MQRKITTASIPSWRWEEDNLVESSLIVPKGAEYIWEVLNQLRYYSVCQYKGQGAFTTYLYRQYLGNNLHAHYIAMTLINGGEDPDVWLESELIELPHWPTVIDYFRNTLPIIQAAQESDKGWDEEKNEE